MKTYRAFIGLGSNLGEREKYLNRAVAALSSSPGVKVIWSSSVYETEPYGKTDQPKFLNAALEIETTLEPPALLKLVKEIERQGGRQVRSERWGPREIDIDVLLYDGLVYSDADVTVPHPDLPQRRFVLVPLREIAPDVVHPVNGMTMEELAEACREQGRVVQTSYHIKY